MQVEPRVPVQPGCYAGMFVGAIIVHDQMQVQTSGRLAIYLFEETDKFLMSMAWHTVTDNRAVEHTEGCEQGGRTIALVIVGHGPATTFLHWQARLGTVEGLDLTLLVHTQDQRFVRRIQIQANNILQFPDKVLVATELECFDQVRFEVMLLPYPPHCCVAKTLGSGHAPCAPMGRLGRFRMQGRFDHRTDFVRRNPWNATRSRSVFFQTRHAKRQKTLPPELHRGTRNLHPLSNFLALRSVGSHENNLGTLYLPHGKSPSPYPRAQDRPLLGR